MSLHPLFASILAAHIAPDAADCAPELRAALVARAPIRHGSLEAAQWALIDIDAVINRWKDGEIPILDALSTIHDLSGSAQP